MNLVMVDVLRVQDCILTNINDGNVKLVVLLSVSTIQESERNLAAAILYTDTCFSPAVTYEQRLP